MVVGLILIYAISERIFGVVKKLNQDHGSVNASRRAGIGPEPGERIAQEDESLAFAGREQVGGLQDRGQLITTASGGYLVCRMRGLVEAIRASSPVERSLLTVRQGRFAC